MLGTRQFDNIRHLESVLVSRVKMQSKPLVPVSATSSLE